MKCLMNGLEVNYPCSPVCAMFGDCVSAFNDIQGGKIMENIINNKVNGEAREGGLGREPYYIVRCDRAGVFAGHIKSREGREVVLTDVRRLWYWDGAASLSQMAVNGVIRPENCKFTVTVPEIIVLDAIEILPCSDKAEKSIREVAEWKM